MSARPCFICGRPNYGHSRHDCCVDCRRPRWRIDYAPEIASAMVKPEPVVRAHRHASDAGDHAAVLGGLKRRHGGSYLDT